METIEERNKLFDYEINSLILEVRSIIEGQKYRWILCSTDNTHQYLFWLRNHTINLNHKIYRPHEYQDDDASSIMNPIFFFLLRHRRRKLSGNEQRYDSEV